MCVETQTNSYNGASVDEVLCLPLSRQTRQGYCHTKLRRF